MSLSIQVQVLDEHHGFWRGTLEDSSNYYPLETRDLYDKLYAVICSGIIITVSK